MNTQSFCILALVEVVPKCVPKTEAKQEKLDQIMSLFLQVFCPIVK